MSLTLQRPPRQPAQSVADRLSLPSSEPVQPVVVALAADHGRARLCRALCMPGR
jgi:hypothetical protein